MAVLKQAINLKFCLAAVFVFYAASMLAPLNLYAQSAPAPEYAVKAAFIYNFAKFVDWPEGVMPEKMALLNLCVSEDSHLGKTVESMRGSTVKGRKIVVNYMKNTRDTSSCQILFIGSTDKKNMKAMLNSVSGRKVLTVGEFEGFAKRGGMINFIIVDNRIAFEINIDAARRGGLSISSQLLKLAEIVREK